MKAQVRSIIIVGGGAAGIGMGVVLEKCGITDYVILEQGKIGASFDGWPSYTRFISPSFAGNFFNAVDLNAVTPDTSPAFSLKTEHPSGAEYAQYLRLVAQHFKVKVREGTAVQSIHTEAGEFVIETDKRLYRSRCVVWAGGEFANPANLPFDGAELCVHSSVVEEFLEDEYTIIGGYESGLELAAHLARSGKSVSIVDANEPWFEHSSDSSTSLAPATRDRLRPFIGTPTVRTFGQSRVVQVEREDTRYAINLENGKRLVSNTCPILATGYHPLSPIVQHLFKQHGDEVLLTDNDESTITPNLFLVGPRVQHDSAIFCFIYKFRQRLPIVAETIAQRLGKDAVDGIAEYQQAHMYLRDLSCCDGECSC